MWIADGVALIASGNLGVSLTHPLDCNAYAVQCGASYVLIDAGVGLETERLAAVVQANGIEEEQICCLLLTHYHLDHAGGAAALNRQFGIEVWAGPRTAAVLEAGDEEAISLAAAKRAAVYPSHVHLERCPVARVIEPGVEFSIGNTTIVPISAPGHSRDMICYLLRQPDRTLLFSGDTIFHGGRISLQDTHDCDVPAYTKSIRRLAGLEFDMLFPGHGLWSLTNGQRHLRQAMSFLDRLLLPPSL